ncbi:hypothetical protein [Maridesulfovibrio sp.]|uniref:hypothetical protein n=1 Tax=Maridesulfovibrio sp. TaxID=2795000 RepID=UPI002A18B2F0|nr:hypothetical protein [Maridesulfovibrio sp.]
MSKLFLIAVCLLTVLSAAAAQERQFLDDVKRPRYGFSVEPASPSEPAGQRAEPGRSRESGELTNEPAGEEVGNSRFGGVFKGTVTVHYKGRMVRTPATLTVSAGGNNSLSHYDYYILPEKGEYLETVWKLEGSDVRRSVTVSGNTVYVTDLIEYESGGGNSQIRTLVFSEDCSSLTFLKTEFDDAARDTATGQIIGRFIRVN